MATQPRTHAKRLPLAATLLMSSALAALAQNDSAFVKIGETTAPVPEAAPPGDGFAIVDGASGDTDSPYPGAIKPLATIRKTGHQAAACPPPPSAAGSVPSAPA